MYGRAYFILRKKWKTMYSIYPNKIKSYRDIIKYIASWTYTPFMDAVLKSKILENKNPLIILIIYFVNLCNRIGIFVQKTFMNKIKKINVYTVKNHSDKNMWLKFLIHPIKSYWGDGTKDWKIYESEFLFYKKYFKLSQDVKNSDAAFLPLTLNYYVKMISFTLQKISYLNQETIILKHIFGLKVIMK